MKDRGERRKKTFNKAVHQAKVYEEVTGVSSKKDVGEVGRFKKCRHLRTRDDDNRTNSEWFGKKNYKKSDRRRADAVASKEKEFKFISLSEMDGDTDE